MKLKKNWFALPHIFFAAALFTINVSTIQPHAAETTKAEAVTSNHHAARDQITMLYDAFGHDASMKILGLLCAGGSGWQAYPVRYR